MFFCDRHKRELSWTQSFQKLYVPTHTNAGNYFIGVLAGFIYYKMRNSDLNEEFLRKLRKIFYIIVIIGFMNFEMSAIFYFNKFEKPSIWISIYAIISKHLWGVQGILLILVILFKAKRKT